MWNWFSAGVIASLHVAALTPDLLLNTISEPANAVFVRVQVRTG
jgi:hypothetical protein